MLGTNKRQTKVVDSLNIEPYVRRVHIWTWDLDFEGEEGLRWRWGDKLGKEQE